MSFSLSYINAVVIPAEYNLYTIKIHKTRGSAISIDYKGSFRRRLSLLPVERRKRIIERILFQTS